MFALVAGSDTTDPADGFAASAPSATTTQAASSVTPSSSTT